MLREVFFWKRVLQESHLAEFIILVFQKKQEHIQKQRGRFCKGWSSLMPSKSLEFYAFACLAIQPTGQSRAHCVKPPSVPALVPRHTTASALVRLLQACAQSFRQGKSRQPT